MNKIPYILITLFLAGSVLGATGSFVGSGLQFYYDDALSTFGFGSTTPTAKVSIQDSTATVLFSIASSSVAGNPPVFMIEKSGHEITAGKAPALTLCLTTPSIVGNDHAGIITVGTGTDTICRITFNTTYSTAPSCVVSASIPSGVASFMGIIHASTTATTLSVTNLATTTGAVPQRMTSMLIAYQCIGKQ